MGQITDILQKASAITAFRRYKKELQSTRKGPRSVMDKLLPNLLAPQDPATTLNTTNTHQPVGLVLHFLGVSRSSLATL